MKNLIISEQSRRCFLLNFVETLCLETLENVPIRMRQVFKSSTIGNNGFHRNSQ